MRGSGIRLPLCYFPQDLHGFLPTPELGLYHAQTAEGTKVAWCNAQSKADFLLGFGVLAFRCQDQTEIHVSLGIVWPFDDGVTEQCNGLGTSPCQRVQDSKVILGLRELRISRNCS